MRPDGQKSLDGSTHMYCDATGRFEARPLSKSVLNSTPYSQRGWCVAEVQWVSTKDEVFGCSPMPPAVFQERVARGEQGLADGLPLKFTHRSDAKLVSQLQEAVFLQHARLRKRLKHDHLPRASTSGIAFWNWHVASNVFVLRSQSRLCIACDNIGDAVAESLAAAVLECKKLRVFFLHKCYAIGDAVIALW
eukprot:s2619_g12.t1